MFALTVRADIALQGAATPDFSRVYTKTVPADFEATELSLFILASSIADRYTDAGAVCVSNVQVVSLLPQAVPTAGAISLDLAA